jgi:hypothetical protein
MRLRRPAYLTIALAGTVLAGCGSSNSGGSHANKSQSSAQSAAAQVSKTWTEFFSSKTSASTKASLLQNGAKFAPVIEAESKNPLAAQSSAKVSAVKLTSPSTARVTYTILLAGKPVVPHTTGTAVKSGSNWLVSDASFCQLLRLEGAAPPGCPKG